MSKKRRTVIGFLGEPVELGRHPNRWERWRPTVALCQLEAFHIDRFELLHKPAATPAAHRIRADIHMVSPRTDVRLTPVELKRDSDFENVYCTLHDFIRQYPFAPATEEYLLNLMTAPPLAQIAWLLLIEAGLFPAKVVIIEPPRGLRYDSPTSIKVIDINRGRSHLPSAWDKDRHRSSAHTPAG